jgi:hypothetical protein
MNPSDTNQDNPVEYPVNRRTNNPWSTVPAHQSRNELNQNLAAANRFHTTALATNRNGQLADVQIQQVRSKLVAPAIFVAVTLGFLGYQIYNQLTKNGRINLNTGFIALAGILLVVAILGVISFIKNLSDLRDRRVIFIESRGHRDKHVTTDEDGADSTTYYYIIGDEKFRVRREGYKVLVDGLLYRAYFTPKGRTLVNIEALESPRQDR